MREQPSAKFKEECVLNWRMFVSVVAIVLAASFAFACGDDDSGDGNGGNGDEPDATQVLDDGEPGNGEEPDDGEAPSGGGSGTLTVGDQTWTLTIQFCGFSPEETQNDRVSFTMVGSGQTADGEEGNLDVTIQDTEEQGRYSGDGTIHSVQIGTWEALTLLGADFEITVDGNNVSAEPTFDDTTTDEVESVAGMLEATCG